MTHSEVDRSAAPPALRLRSVSKSFALSSGWSRAARRVTAVDGVSLDVRVGTAVGLVGESGCGKSTTGRLAMGLLHPDDGEVQIGGRTMYSASSSADRAARLDAQMVFQDPYSSLDPRMSVRASVAEPLLRMRSLSRQQRRERVDEALEMVGLSRSDAERHPAAFSGGQRQRVGIARALVSEPKLVVLDEPVSALDVSVQAQVLNLLQDLQQRREIAYLFISHDLSVVRHLCQEVAVMYLGRIVERGSAEAIFTRPEHPYTRALLSSVPIPTPRLRGQATRIVLSGDLPSPSDPPSGCRFRTRCWKARDLCANTIPELLTVTGTDPHVPGTSHQVACHFPGTSAEVSESA